MKNAIRKILALMLSMLMLTLTGCKTGGKDLPTTEIITNEGQKEVPLVTLVTDVNWQSTNLRTVLNSVPGSGQEFQIEVEALPRTEPDRSNRLTRMRTEMMAGKGPDLFILDLRVGTIGYSKTGGLPDPLFPFPEKAMKNRLFLPLDGYMENAEHSDFSSFLPVLMEAGRNDEGQQLIPLTYSFDVGVIDAGTFDIPLDRVSTRDDMLNSGVPVLEYFSAVATSWHHMPLGYFGADTDYENETLTFTEDELFDEAMLWREYNGKSQDGYYDSIREFENFASGDFTTCLMAGTIGEPRTIIPSRNRDGGVTAYVGTIAAVNRNAGYPDYAFSIIDLISSESVMRDYALYDTDGGNVANTGLGSPDKPLQWLPMSAETYEVYQELIGQVTVVKFPTALEQTVREEVYLPCFRQELETEADVRAAVHKAYMTMLMMLAES